VVQIRLASCTIPYSFQHLNRSSATCFSWHVDTAERWSPFRPRVQEQGNKEFVLHLTDRAEGSCAHATCSIRMSKSDCSGVASHHRQLVASTAVVCRRVGRLQAHASGSRKLARCKHVLGLPKVCGTPCTQQRHGQQKQGCQANIYSSSQPVSFQPGNGHMHDGLPSSAPSAFGSKTIHDTIASVNGDTQVMITEAMYDILAKHFAVHNLAGAH